MENTDNYIYIYLFREVLPRQHGRSVVLLCLQRRRRHAALALAGWVGLSEGLARRSVLGGLQVSSTRVLKQSNVVFSPSTSSVHRNDNLLVACYLLLATVNCEILRTMKHWATYCECARSYEERCKVPGIETNPPKIISWTGVQFDTFLWSLPSRHTQNRTRSWSQYTANPLGHFIRNTRILSKEIQYPRNPSYQNKAIHFLQWISYECFSKIFSKRNNL